jgi:hypothetical protein
VNSRGEFFTFIWNSEEKQAGFKIGEKVNLNGLILIIKTQIFLELHILVDELTKDVSLMVVDFAER